MAFFDRRLDKLYLFSSNRQFCHKDVSRIIDDAVRRGIRRNKITVYDEKDSPDDHPHQNDDSCRTSKGYVVPSYLLSDEPLVNLRRDHQLPEVPKLPFLVQRKRDGHSAPKLHVSSAVGAVSILPSARTTQYTQTDL